MGPKINQLKATWIIRRLEDMCWLEGGGASSLVRCAAGKPCWPMAKEEKLRLREGGDASSLLLIKT